MEIRQKKELNIKESEIQSISRSKEQEISRLKNEKLQSEIDHKNRELASTTMHLMSKNEFMSTVKNGLKGILKQEEKFSSKKDLNKIISRIDKHIDDTEDWKHFEFHFDEVHGDFSRRIKERFPNLTPQELKLCAYLRLNLNTK